MDYRKTNGKIYLRVDKGEEVLQTIREVCKKENIASGYFQGIGACDRAVLSTFIPQENDFIHHELSGMLEMIALSGNISRDTVRYTKEENELFLHAHATFSYLKDEENHEVCVTAGHIKEARIGYTGEIIINICDEAIERMIDEKSGIDIWKLK